MHLKKGPVAALAAALVGAEFWFFSLGGWLLVMAAAAAWGTVAYRSVRAERRIGAQDCFLCGQPRRIHRGDVCPATSGEQSTGYFG